MYTVIIGKRRQNVATMADAVRLTLGLCVPFSVITESGEPCMKQYGHALRRLKQAWKAKGNEADVYTLPDGEMFKRSGACHANKH